MRKIIIPLVLVVISLGWLDNDSLADSASSVQSCPIATHFVKVGGGTISYNSIGKGSYIVLLHGLFAQKEQWNSMMCLLSEAGYAAIALDLPGYGESKGFALIDYKLENQVKILHELVNVLQIETFDLAGSSMGGAIAALYAQHHSPQIRSLAFIGSPQGIIDWAESLKNAIYQGINPFIPIDERQFDLEMSLLFVTLPNISKEVKAEKIQDYVARNRYYQQVWDIVNLYDDALCQDRSIKIPTLIIWGEGDKIFDVRGAEKLQSCMPNSQLLKLPNAGHLLLIEKADIAALTYINFLQLSGSK